jgi:hypothetical protein
MTGTFLRVEKSQRGFDCELRQKKLQSPEVTRISQYWEDAPGRTLLAPID